MLKASNYTVKIVKLYINLVNLRSKISTHTICSYYPIYLEFLSSLGQLNVLKSRPHKLICGIPFGSQFPHKCAELYSSSFSVVFIYLYTRRECVAKCCISPLSTIITGHYLVTNCYYLLYPIDFICLSEKQFPGKCLCTAESV